MWNRRGTYRVLVGKFLGERDNTKDLVVDGGTQ